MFGSASRAHRRFCRRVSVRRLAPCLDVPRIHCRCLMQPKLRYTPIVIFRCILSFHKQERTLALHPVPGFAERESSTSPSTDAQ